MVIEARHAPCAPAGTVENCLASLEASHRNRRPTTVAPAGAPWTDEEHSAFLAGLKVYGRVSSFICSSRKLLGQSTRVQAASGLWALGTLPAVQRPALPATHARCPARLPSRLQGQWKQISRYYVPSRTPTQVASHAQKHFLRQSGAQKRRSRFSAVEEAAAAPQPPVPQLLPPLPLSGLHRPPGMVAAAPPATAPGVPAMPTLFGHSLPPAQHAAAFLPPQPRLVGAPGTVVGGVAMGVPIGVLPPLPSITTASEWECWDWE